MTNNANQKPAAILPTQGAAAVRLRRGVTLVLFAIIWCGGCLFFLDGMARTGLTSGKWLMFALYVVLWGQLSFGFSQALLGFVVRMLGRDGTRISKCLLPDEPLETASLKGRCALLFPIYNEEPQRFFAGVKVLYRALKDAGQLEHFDFFVLSDSNDSNTWVEEEIAWMETVRDLGAAGKLFYRKRVSNINQKSGNVSDFCRRWGNDFDYMICFDADSLMSANAVVRLVRMMEENSRAGIIQTMPALFNGQSFFARLQQFANRVHGGISGAGLHFWQQNEGNYWGHNAIIRVKPFIEHCTLPELPGGQPIGGRILSHDFVEAALMRKAGFDVWLAYDEKDTYEEMPASLLDFAARDRRWSQGNLQHAWILLFGRIPLANRLHMLNGILAYLTAPLWLLFLLLGTVNLYSWEGSGLSLIVRPSFLPGNALSLTGQGSLLFVATLALLFLPKVFTVVWMACNKTGRAAFGGLRKITLSVLLEVVIFSLLAPAMMLFHSRFVFEILTGRRVTWNAQQRVGGGVRWRDAWRAQGGHFLIGVLWSVLAWVLSPVLFWWMSPVLLGWILSVPLSVWTGHERVGLYLRDHGLLLTPEELNPPPIVRALMEERAQQRQPRLPIPELTPDYGLLQAIADPYINALHRALLHRPRQGSAEAREALRQLEVRLLMEGAPALLPREKLRLLYDEQCMARLHHAVWNSSDAALAGWWRLALSRYNRESLFRVEPQLLPPAAAAQAG